MHMRIGSGEFIWGSRTYVMGIVNVTPDSFSGDGVGRDGRAAARRAEGLQKDGADIIDLGGESTRPGHNAVPLDEELRRVRATLPAVLAAASVPISIDTRKAVVARYAVEQGVALVNDVSGLHADPEMAHTVRSLNVPLIVMARGASRKPDVVARVRQDLDESLLLAVGAEIQRGRLLIDPGFGFGKDWRANLLLLRRLAELRGYRLPILVGLSRKSTITRVLGSEPEHRVAANAALTALAIAGGADIVRAHDVKEMAAAARLADAVLRAPVALAAPGTSTLGRESGDKRHEVESPGERKGKTTSSFRSD